MITSLKHISPMAKARWTGILYILMIPLGILGIIYVPETLIVDGDMAATAANIAENIFTFRLSILSALAVQVNQIFLVLALYILLKPVNRNIALFMVITILVAVPIAMLNELNQFVVLQLLGGADYLAGFSVDQINGMISFFLNLHEQGIVIAQIFWGIWLFPMGWLIFKSGYIPKFIGILLMIACFGYLLDSFTRILFPDFGITVSEFTFPGEVILPFWLLIKGVNVEKWNERNSQKRASLMAN